MHVKGHMAWRGAASQERKGAELAFYYIITYNMHVKGHMAWRCAATQSISLVGLSFWLYVNFILG